MSSMGNARVSVLFANGTFGIWELDARNDLKPVLPFTHVALVCCWMFLLWPDCKENNATIRAGDCFLSTCNAAA